MILNNYSSFKIVLIYHYNITLLNLIMEHQRYDIFKKSKNNYSKHGKKIKN